MISLITITYNSIATIEDTIISIRNQSFKEFEWIVIDGGSTDGTLELIKSYNLHTILVSQPDDGIYDALNKGISFASGGVIGILHSDDTFFNNDVLKVINETFLLNPDFDGIYGDLIYVNRYNKKVIRTWRSSQYTTAKIRFGWMPPHPTIYIKSQIFSKVGIYNLRYKISADYDFIIRLFAINVKLIYINSPLVYMKMGGVSNRSIGSLIQKYKEDLHIVRSNKMGNVLTIICKSLIKFPQFINFKNKHQ